MACGHKSKSMNSDFVIDENLKEFSNFLVVKGKSHEKRSNVMKRSAAANGTVAVWNYNFSECLWKCEVLINGKIIGFGKATKKKFAMEEAAKAALDKLKDITTKLKTSAKKVPGKPDNCADHLHTTSSNQNQAPNVFLMPTEPHVKNNQTLTNDKLSIGYDRPWHALFEEKQETLSKDVESTISSQFTVLDIQKKIITSQSRILIYQEQILGELKDRPSIRNKPKLSEIEFLSYENQILSNEITILNNQNHILWELNCFPGHTEQILCNQFKKLESHCQIICNQNIMMSELKVIKLKDFLENEKNMTKEREAEGRSNEIMNNISMVFESQGQIVTNQVKILDNQVCILNNSNPNISRETVLLNSEHRLIMYKNQVLANKSKISYILMETLTKQNDIMKKEETIRVNQSQIVNNEIKISDILNKLTSDTIQKERNCNPFNDNVLVSTELKGIANENCTLMSLNTFYVGEIEKVVEDNKVMALQNKILTNQQVVRGNQSKILDLQMKIIKNQKLILNFQNILLSFNDHKLSNDQGPMEDFIITMSAPPTAVVTAEEEIQSNEQENPQQDNLSNSTPRLEDINGLEPLKSEGWNNGGGLGQNEQGVSDLISSKKCTKRKIDSENEEAVYKQRKVNKTESTDRMTVNQCKDLREKLLEIKREKLSLFLESVAEDVVMTDPECKDQPYDKVLINVKEVFLKDLVFNLMKEYLTSRASIFSPPSDIVISYKIQEEEEEDKDKTCSVCKNAVITMKCSKCMRFICRKHSKNVITCVLCANQVEVKVDEYLL